MRIPSLPWIFRTPAYRSNIRRRLGKPLMPLELNPSAIYLPGAWRWYREPIVIGWAIGAAFLVLSLFAFGGY